MWMCRSEAVWGMMKRGCWRWWWWWWKENNFWGKRFVYTFISEFPKCARFVTLSSGAFRSMWRLKMISKYYMQNDLKWFLNEVIKTNWNLNGRISHYHIACKRICAYTKCWHIDALTMTTTTTTKWKQESHFFNFRHHDYFASLFILCPYFCSASRSPSLVGCYFFLHLVRPRVASNVYNEQQTEYK